MNKTVLSFKIQENGAEGLKITNSENIILEDFTIEDAVGDNIKVTDTKGITFRRIKSAWTGEISKKNGAYALYPVICENVLIEACEVLGASDAGIYVGQSKNVIIRNNKVYWNVAGIESENSENVSIYNNQAYNNTGGILVFDLPGLTRYGRKIKVYDNEVYDNNLFNFAPPGNIVGAVPSGTGIMVLATREVEINNNKLENNKTIEVAVVSYSLIDTMNDQKSQEKRDPGSSAQIFEEGAKMDLEYDPYPGAIYIHDNTYGEVSWLPNLSNEFGKLFLWKFGFDRPQIIWDGMVPENYLLSNNTLNPDYKICIQEVGVKTAILDAANDFEGLVTDPESFNCET
jgi:parallel beta-helix repeat protein